MAFLYLGGKVERSHLVTTSTHFSLSFFGSCTAKQTPPSQAAPKGLRLEAKTVSCSSQLRQLLELSRL